MATKNLTHEDFADAIGSEGIMAYAQPGALQASQLDQLIQGARDLDMNDVRRQIAEREAQATPTSE